MAQTLYYTVCYCVKIQVLFNTTRRMLTRSHVCPRFAAGPAGRVRVSDGAGPRQRRESRSGPLLVVTGAQPGDGRRQRHLQLLLQQPGGPAPGGARRARYDSQDAGAIVWGV